MFVPVMFYLTQKRSGVEYKRPALIKAVLGGLGAGALRLSGMAEKERPGSSGTSSAWAARGTRCGRTGMEPEPSRPPPALLRCTGPGRWRAVPARPLAAGTSGSPLSHCEETPTRARAPLHRAHTERAAGPPRPAFTSPFMHFFLPRFVF